MRFFRYVRKRILFLTGFIAAVMISLSGVQSQPGGIPDFKKMDRNPGLSAKSYEKIREESDAQRIEAYLDAVSSGDREAIRKYMTENYDHSFLKRLPPDIHILSQMAIYYTSAGLGYDLHETGPSRKEGLTALLHNKLTGSWLNLTIPVAKDSPHKITGFVKLEPAPRPSDVPPSGKLSDKDIVKRLKMCMEKLIADDEFSGVVLLARNGRPLFQKAYGFASRSYRVSNLPDTKFNIASVGKMFTGVAVAQLAERGKLSFEDPLSTYLPPDWLAPEISQKIQIRHLLTHTSGLGNYFRKLYGQYKQLLFRKLDDYKTLICDETLAFEPGTRWAYSSTGMMLLGVVIEKITRQSYFDYVRSEIYTPAGMRNTDAFEKDLPVENRATAYAKDYSGKEPVLREVLFTRVMKGMPSGGSYSTAEDLLKFDTALRSHKLLGPEYMKTVLTPKPEINSPSYGYGFHVTENEAGRVAGHGGDGQGVSCQFKAYLEAGYTVAVLSNFSHPAAYIVEQVIEQLLLVR